MDVPSMKDACWGQESTKHALIAALGDTAGRGVNLLYFVFWAV